MQSAHQVVSHLLRHFCFSAFLADVDILPLVFECASMRETGSLFILKSSLRQPEDTFLTWSVAKACAFPGMNIKQGDLCLKPPSQPFAVAPVRVMGEDKSGRWVGVGMPQPLRAPLACGGHARGDLQKQSDLGLQDSRPSVTPLAK